MSGTWQTQTLPSCVMLHRPPLTQGVAVMLLHDVALSTATKDICVTLTGRINPRNSLPESLKSMTVIALLKVATDNEITETKETAWNIRHRSSYRMSTGKSVCLPYSHHHHRRRHHHRHHMVGPRPTTTIIIAITEAPAPSSSLF